MPSLRQGPLPVVAGCAHVRSELALCRSLQSGAMHSAGLAAPGCSFLLLIPVRPAFEHFAQCWAGKWVRVTCHIFQWHVAPYKGPRDPLNKLPATYYSLADRRALHSSIGVHQVSEVVPPGQLCNLATQ